MPKNGTSGAPPTSLVFAYPITQSPDHFDLTPKKPAGNFGSLYWLYLRISLVAWLAMVFLGCIWIRLVRPERIGASFLITQLMLLSWLGTRLWQRTSETI
jgi:hypothetical protein